MRLLVSVRSVEEARAAVRGGADIIDAKEPGAGALAPVAPDMLAAIQRAVPSELPLSVALGDIGSAGEARHAVASLPLTPRPGGIFVKFAPARGVESAYEIAREAVAAARVHTGKPKVVVAASVDRLRRPGSELEELAAATADAGAYGILLDTAEKTGKSLLDWCDVSTLTLLTRQAHELRLWVALAGSVASEQLPRLCQIGADIVGVRGAVCTGGRNGTLDSGRVVLFRVDLTSALAEDLGAGRTGRSLFLQTGTSLL